MEHIIAIVTTRSAPCFVLFPKFSFVYYSCRLLEVLIGGDYCIKAFLKEYDFIKIALTYLIERSLKVVAAQS